MSMHDYGPGCPDCAVLSAALTQKDEEQRKVIAHIRSYATDFPEDFGGAFGILAGLDDDGTCLSADEFIAGAINNVVVMRALMRDRAEKAEALVAQKDETIQQLQAGWRDIATAPKDGTQVWLWWDGQRRLAHWHEAVNPPSIGGRFANWLTDDRGSVSAVTRPTLWAPLPAPPTPLQEPTK
jgi:hypothetical protein